MEASIDAVKGTWSSSLNIFFLALTGKQMNDLSSLFISQVSRMMFCIMQQDNLWQIRLQEPKFIKEPVSLVSTPSTSQQHVKVRLLSPSGCRLDR